MLLSDFKATTVFSDSKENKMYGFPSKRNTLKINDAAESVCLNEIDITTRALKNETTNKPNTESADTSYLSNLQNNSHSETRMNYTVSSFDFSKTVDYSVATVVGSVAGVLVKFMIDSGADVNTVDIDVFDQLMNNDPMHSPIFGLKKGTDKPLKAYATPEPIPVIATFVAELFITPDRPRLLEKFYVIQGAKPLLCRGTATRYSLLRMGLEVPVRNALGSDKFHMLPSELNVNSTQTEFPKFNVPPVLLTYDKSMPPSRNIFTSIPPAFKEETERRLEELLCTDIIEEVTEGMDRSFCSSLLVVPKGKNDIRLVVDLRGPNKTIIRTPFKMPTLEAIVSDLRGATWFSTIDLSSAFFHVVLHENCRHLTNFFAGNATFRFKRLPFGLCNSPDIFQEILQTIVLSNCPGVVNYLDDILVFGKSKLAHDINLKEVLRRLREHNVLLNSAKCVFGKQSVKFIGFRLSHKGWSVDDDKRKAIESFRRPESIAEVKSFLGLINFTERFIVNRAEKTKKLRQLTKSNVFKWTHEEEQEFTYLKTEALKSIVRLGYFDHNDKVELYVDASPIGIGAVLVQYNVEEEPRIIACASKALTLAEQRYPQTQKEALAIVWGVERFAYYLTSKQFVVRTDSEANEYIFGGLHRTSRRAISRAEAWALRLLPYQFRIERIPGDLNVADALSRLIHKSQVDESFDEDNDKHMLYALDAGSMSISLAEIQLAAENDNELDDVKLALETGKWPDKLRRYESESKNLKIFGSLVLKNYLIVLPGGLRRRALETAHQGHIGCGATKRILREYFWWPNMAKEAEDFVARCETCLVISRKNPPIPLSSRQLPNGPWEILQIDFLSIQGCGSGHLLMCVDIYSRYLHVIEMKQTDARHTNAALCKIFEVWGLPLILQSDNGPPFQSNEFIDFWEAKGVRVQKSIPLSAQSNGAVERQNQGVIKAMAAAKEEKRGWKGALEEYLHMHNTRKHHSRLGITPFELLVGWRYRGTFPSLWEPRESIDRIKIREDDAFSKLVSKKFADARKGAKESDIAVGDRVVVAVTQRSKTDPTFTSERFSVLAREGAKVVIRSDDGVQLSRNIQDIKRLPIEMDSESGEVTERSRQNSEGKPTMTKLFYFFSYRKHFKLIAFFFRFCSTSRQQNRHRQPFCYTRRASNDRRPK